MPSTGRRAECYRVLGLSNAATQDDIRVAYKKLALKWHPDRHIDDKEHASEKFIEVHDAYRELTDKIEHRKEKHDSKESKGNDESSSSPPSTPPSSTSSSSSRDSTDSCAGSTSRSPPPSPKPSTTTFASDSQNSSSSSSSRSSKRHSSPSRPAPEGEVEKPDSKHTKDKDHSPKSHHTEPHASGHHSTSTHVHHGKHVHANSAGTPHSKPASDKAHVHKHGHVDTHPPCKSAAARFSDQTRADSPRPRGFINRLRKRPRQSSVCQERPTKPASTHHKSEHHHKAEHHHKSHHEHDAASVDTENPGPLHPVRNPRGDDTEWMFPLKLTLEELYNGTHYTFDITRQLLSGETKEVRLELEVPPGCQTGTKIRCPKVGNECKDGSAQDVVFVVEEISHKRFSRVKNDLVMDVSLPWVESLNDVDGELCIEGIDGREYQASIRYSTDRVTTGKFRVVGGGMPFRKGGKVVGRGDLVVTWNLVITPSSKTMPHKKGLHFRH